MPPQILHNWLGLAVFALHLVVVVRLVYLEQEHQWFGPEDAAVIILAETALALQVIAGLYLSWPLEIETRIMHHLSGVFPVFTNIFFVLLLKYSDALKGRRIVRGTLLLFIVNSFVIFLSYWVSIGASMQWWLYPEHWSNEVQRTWR